MQSVQVRECVCHAAPLTVSPSSCLVMQRAFCMRNLCCADGGLNGPVISPVCAAPGATAPALNNCHRLGATRLRDRHQAHTERQRKRESERERSEHGFVFEFEFGCIFVYIHI